MRLLQTALQTLIAVIGWLLFAVAWWYVVSTHSVPSGGWVTLAMLAVAAAVTFLMTYFWVRYNVGIHRRKGPRRTVPQAAYDYSRDANGVSVRADFAQMRGARYVVISQASGPSAEKVYAAGSAELSPEEYAACTM